MKDLSCCEILVCVCNIKNLLCAETANLTQISCHFSIWLLFEGVLLPVKSHNPGVCKLSNGLKE